MFQQAVSPVSNCDYNNKKHSKMYQGLCTSEVKARTFASFPSDDLTFSRRAPERASSLGMFDVHNQLGSSQSHNSVSALRNNQELVSSCKSSCRLFGFSLTDDTHVANKEVDASTITLPINAGPSFTRLVEDEFHPSRALQSKAVGSNCTKVIDLSILSMQDVIVHLMLHCLWIILPTLCRVCCSIELRILCAS